MTENGKWRITADDGSFDVVEAEECEIVDDWFVFKVYRPPTVVARFRCGPVYSVINGSYSFKEGKL